MSLRETISSLLTTADLYPILVDVGASGAPPPIWAPLARHAIYVGFDPDARDMHPELAQRYCRAHIVDRAVAADPMQDQVTFYLTAFPACSSTLPPDVDALADYLFAPYFAVEDRVNAPATTLDVALQQLALPGVDWLKLDTQGTDLRLFESLAPSTRQRVLAVDVEPGLIDAYQGEDLFVAAHRALTQEGFWLSDLVVKGAVRMQQASLKELGRDAGYAERAMRISPGWCEARYLRTTAWLAQQDLDPRAYLLTWIFAMLDQQPGFALDVSLAYASRFGVDATSALLQSESQRQIARAYRKNSVWRFVRAGVRRLERLWYGGE